MSARQQRILKIGALLTTGILFQVTATGCTSLDVVQTGLLGLLAFSTFYLAKEVS